MGYMKFVPNTSHKTSQTRKDIIKNRNRCCNKSSQQGRMTEDRRSESNGEVPILNTTGKKINALLCRLLPRTWYHSKQDALRTRNTLQLPSDLVSTITHALVADREAHATRSRLVATGKSADAAIRQLDQRIFAFDVRLDELMMQDLAANAEQVETLREAKRMIGVTRGKFKAKLEDLEQELEDVSDTIHNTRSETYAMLDGVFVENDLIEQRQIHVPAASIAQNTKSNNAAVGRWNHEQLTGDVDGQVSSIDERRGKGLQRSAGVPNLRLMAVGSLGGKSTPKPATDDLEDPKLQAERDYKFYKLLVGQAEADFDDRQEAFDRERDQLMLKRAAGETDESMSQLDKRHILETQKLAQRFAKAEDAYYAAKDAAVAAGVILGSDVESGFVSRDDDGYSLSMEIDGEAFVDRGRIERWLATLPDYEARKAPHEVEFDDLDNAKHGEDDFDLESVKMWETRSAIAEGPWRRRIDKWNLIRSSAAVP